jgi:DNA (cytosine-5)-methyltransferase 1
MSQYTFTFTDLFAWIWWFHIAFHNLWGKLVSAVERDKPARETYQANFFAWNEEVFLGGKFFEDITNIVPDQLPDHNILCAWFPCQSFSIAGYRKWFSDARWNVFFNLCDIIAHKKPEVIFLENVKNLKSHDEWKTFQIILETLESLWYHIKFQVLNCCEYGWIPQNRERIYIIWFRDKDACERFSFPDKIPLTLWVRDMLDTVNDPVYYYENSPLYPILKAEITDKNTSYQRRRKYVRANKSWVFPTLTANMGTWWHNVPLVLDKKWIRKLTPRECFRIQWFPEDFVLPNMWKSQLYKQAWNAVSVPVIQRIWVNVLKAIFPNKNKWILTSAIKVSHDIVAR